ncbi:MAG: hypothetical protein PHH77_02480 [Victivallaceae bacterium]|nr:hypothetical protein [Victivallaceae bacterium]
MKKKLSKLQKINLRDVWEHEALDFTTWLARQENLDALSEEVGVNIKLIKTEANTGKFSVDILAEEEMTGRKIIIENQLEDTNHDHLGKIITYASGYDAKIEEEIGQPAEWVDAAVASRIKIEIVKWRKCCSGRIFCLPAYK